MRKHLVIVLTLAFGCVLGLTWSRATEDAGQLTTQWAHVQAFCWPTGTADRAWLGVFDTRTGMVHVYSKEPACLWAGVASVA